MVRSGPGEVLALCGGVGGSKLALGLHKVVKPGDLTVVVNTGDDFEHLGLHISPDIDTVTYTLGEVGDPVRGWGRAEESWNFMAALSGLGGPDWFMLGDRDIATHVLRSQRLRSGASLSEVTARLARALDIAAHILPMSDDPVRTRVHTPDGVLAFQEYFVGRRCEPRVTRLTFEGAPQAAPHPRLMRALADPDLAAIIICPSNPYLSIDPLLALPGVRDALARAPAPVVAVSPLVGGKAVKGPTGKIMAELGLEVSNRAICSHYEGILDGYVIDIGDSGDVAGLPVPAAVTRTLMTTLEDRVDLGRNVLEFAASLPRRSIREDA